MVSEDSVTGMVSHCSVFIEPKDNINLLGNRKGIQDFKEAEMCVSILSCARLYWIMHD